MDASTEHKKGIEFGENGAFDAAIDSFSNVIRLLPDDAQAYYNRGLAYLKSGELEKAIADFDEVIRLRPGLDQAYNNRGLAKKNKGDFDQAIADFDEAVRLKPSHARAYRNRGLAYEASGNQEKAQADFAKAMELFSSSGVSEDAREIYLTDRARKVMQLARDEAYQKNNEYIGTEHVLLGLLKEGSGITPSMLKRIERNFGKVRAEVTRQLEKNTSIDVTVKMRQTPAVVRALEVATAEARTLGHKGVQAEHILLGLLQSPEEVAGSVLLGFGIVPEEVRAEIDEWD